MSGRLVIGLGVILQGTALPEQYVLAGLVLVILVSLILLASRVSLKVLRRVFIIVTLFSMLGMGVLAAGWSDTYVRIVQEDDLVEWIAADCLIVGCIIGLIVTVRRSLAGAPLPVGTFLMTGYFIAFGRELEYGGPFFGEKLWFKRSLLVPRAYFDPSYFEKFIRKLEVPRSPETLHAVHLVISGLLILVAALATIHLIRHRKLFLEQLRSLAKMAYGRYFLLGLGGFLSAHLLGKIIHWAQKAEIMRYWPHRYIEEPLEFWGAVGFYFSMLALWIAADREALPEALPAGATS